VSVNRIESHPSFIIPDWSAPPNVQALSTMRIGGFSEGNYSSFNLARHVFDVPGRVEANRAMLQKTLGSEVFVHSLDQVHGSQVIEATRSKARSVGDAAFTSKIGIACSVATADCVPVLLASMRGDTVAAVHAGWRGLAGGVVENAVARIPCDASDICAWMGPAIAKCHFEVGAEVRKVFLQAAQESLRLEIDRCFLRANAQDKYFADLYGIVRIKLKALGVHSIFGGDYCTFCDESRFYSFRRQSVTGRMVSLIYLNT
jgi:polyphenol oxidase